MRDIVDKRRFSIIRVGADHVHSHNMLPIIILDNELIRIELQAVVITCTIVQVLEWGTHSLISVDVLAPKVLCTLASTDIAYADACARTDEL